MLWALVAAFIKATTDTFTQYGFGGMFLHWPIYALAVAGPSAEYLNQAALHVGPLSVSQPFIVVVDPIVSIGLSIWIFDETFTDDGARLTRRRSPACAWRSRSSSGRLPPPWIQHGGHRQPCRPDVRVTEHPARSETTPASASS